MSESLNAAGFESFTAHRVQARSLCEEMTENSEMLQNMLTNITETKKTYR